MLNIRNRSERGGTLFRLGLITVVLAVAVTLVVLGLGEEDKTIEPGSTFSVARGDLLISVIEGGNLKARDSENIDCEVEGESTIVTLVPEGTFVQEGDLLVEMDAADLEERATQQEISYESAKAAWVQAKENLKIQLSQNESDILAGELQVRFAEMELEKYLQADGKRDVDRNMYKSEIVVADAELKRAQDRVEWTRKLEQKGFVTQNELDADVLSESKSAINLQRSKDEMRLAETFDFKMTEERLAADVKEAKLGLDRIKAKADSQIALKEADQKSREAQFKLQEERFNKMKEQLEKTRILAPQAGMVVYGSGDDHDYRRGGSSSNVIEEGAKVRYRQTLITLPDVSVMLADTKVHESAVDKVAVGQRAEISIDAYPDRRYKGVVTKVSILPDSQSRWLNPDLKVYSTDITLEDGTDNLKPGMSAKVEIIVKRLKEVLYVPIQSVYRRGEHEICYLLTSENKIEIRKVVVGLNNEEFVEIAEGLDQGERVLLYAPSLGELPEELLLEEEKQADSAGEPAVTEKKEAKPEQSERQGPPGGMPEMTPEMRANFEKMRDMSDEEKKKHVEKLQKEGKIPSFGGPRGGGEGRGNRGDRGER